MATRAKITYWRTAASMSYPEGRLAAHATGGHTWILDADGWAHIGPPDPLPSWEKITATAARRLSGVCGFTFTGPPRP